MFNVTGADDLELEILKRESSHNALQARVDDFTVLTPSVALSNKAHSCEDMWQELYHLITQARYVLTDHIYVLSDITGYMLNHALVL